ncbi:MAG: nucleotidyl transferase AbiEii/AbiGii toxin family protein [Burkholderiales bacterium]|jgi:predicted nucleotidyltransferase component of viral defense system|nr:nucleotidyl transferase AbiEii/AbiGii toxin family protein [Burkholderiales bacterium]
MSHRLKEWVQDAPDARQRELRQAVHTILVAVTQFRQSGLQVVMKGGILLAVEYDGDRYTKDVDFSTRALVAEIPPERFADTLNEALAAASQSLDYGLDCRVQSRALIPPGEDRSWPTLQLKVGYAPLTDGSRHGRFSRGQATDTVAVEISYNEVITDSEWLELGDGVTVEASTLVDLVAEKFRAMLQQPIRNRVRRQDAYDLYCLLEAHGNELERVRTAVRDALILKSEGRGIEVRPDSLRDPEIERRSRAEYPQLADEIRRALPEFEAVYGAVREYYEGMGW